MNGKTVKTQNRNDTTQKTLSIRNTYFQAAELLPRSTIILLASRCHLALHALRTGDGSASTVRTLLEVTIAAGLLSSRGYEAVPVEESRNAEVAIKRTVASGLNFGRWCLMGEDFNSINRIVGKFESQIEEASIADIEMAFVVAKEIAGL